MKFGILLSDVPTSVPPRQQIKDLFKIVEAAQRNGITYIAIGQHFLYGDLRWLQPVPVLARLAAEVDAHVRLCTHVMIAPFYHPVMLAEEIATLDIVTEGRLDFGVGLGYRQDEFGYFGVPYKERGARLDETLELLPKLWTEDEVSFEGRFWNLDAVQPHIKPYQEPHPPLWVGGHSDRGARRAGRFGDAYPVPPEATEEQLASRFAIVKEEFAKRGKAFGPQPLRRNIQVGRTTEEAADDFIRTAQGRYLAYSQRGLDVYTEEEIRANFLKSTANHAVIGTAEEVAESLRGLATRFPVDPYIFKPQWPDMTGDDTVEVLDLYGKTVVPALADHPPLTDLR